MMEGSCLCGGVRYQASQPLFSVMCHCNSCQRTSGSAFSQNLFCDQEAFKITSGKELISEYKDESTESGNAVRRNFCSRCGCPLYILSDDNPMMQGKVVLTSGGLSDAAKQDNAPTMEFYCRSKRDWVSVPAERRTFQGGSA